MAPILIDGRGLMKLGFYAIALTFFVFSGGFVFGYQQANDQQLARSHTEPLALPVNTVSLPSDIKQQKPEVVVAGAGIDVDRPEDVSDAEDVLTPQKLSKKIEIKLPVVDVNSPLFDGNLKQQNKKSISKIEVVLITNDIRNTAKYSVQVGMYGLLSNAKIMVEKLQNNNFNAYVTDYLNNNDQVRFNVRFGYYPNKKAAVFAINQYRDILKGDGYLVNYTIDSLMYPKQSESSAPELAKTVDQHTDAVTEPALSNSIQISISEAKPSLIDTINKADVLSSSQAKNLDNNLVIKTGKVNYN